MKYENNSLGASKFEKLFEENFEDAKRMWQYCESWSTSIEINYKTQDDKEILTQAFFSYDPHVNSFFCAVILSLLQNHLNEDDKKTILLHIKRGTPQEKLFDLLKWTDAIKSKKNYKV